MKKFFGLEEHGTDVKTEIRAGVTTFFAMAYIIFLNPVFLSAAGMDADGALIATCISAVLGSALAALLSNRPIAMASGMGMNAFFAYTICGAMGYTWQQALGFTFVSGLLFLVLVLTPAGKQLIRAVPSGLKQAIAAGIGLFISEIGLLDAGIISLATGLPSLGDLKSAGVLVAVFGTLFTAILLARKVKGSLLVGMLVCVVLSMAAGVTPVPSQIVAMPTAISKVFLKLDFSGVLSAGLMQGLTLILSLTIVDMFDTTGFLIGTVAASGEDLDEIPGVHRILAADAGATVLGALCGASTVTSYAESAAGIAAGGKTGLTALTTAGCFLLAVFFAPLASVVTSAATAPVLIIVGMYLFAAVKKIDLSTPDDAIPAFLTIIAIPLSYSITTGIAVGMIALAICKLCAGKAKELPAAAYILAAVFVIYLCL